MLTSPNRHFPPNRHRQEERSHSRITRRHLQILRLHLPARYNRSLPRSALLRSASRRSQVDDGSLQRCNGRQFVPLRHHQQPGWQHRRQCNGVLFPEHVQRCSIWLVTTSHLYTCFMS